MGKSADKHTELKWIHPPQPLLLTKHFIYEFVWEHTSELQTNHVHSLSYLKQRDTQFLLRRLQGSLSINRHSFQLKVAFHVSETRAAVARGHGILTQRGSSASVESIHERTKMDAGDLQPGSAVNHDV